MLNIVKITIHVVKLEMAWLYLFSSQHSVNLKWIFWTEISYIYVFIEGVVDHFHFYQCDLNIIVNGFVVSER